MQFHVELVMLIRCRLMLTFCCLTGFWLQVADAKRIRMKVQRHLSDFAKLVC